jgi:hypothetical protein
MAKKHWIFVKRGLSEDPKHRERMGMAIYVYLHILDRADWETGKVGDWVDGDEANDMCMSPRTLRDWRQKLVDLGYIACKQRQHSLEITIYNWINPREYNTGPINLKNDPFEGDTQGALLDAPSKFQGDTQGDTQVRSVSVTPTYDSSSLPPNEEEDVSSPSKEKKKILKLFEAAALNVFGNDFTAWRKLARELELEQVQIRHEDGQVIVSGAGEKAAFLQDRYAKSFSRSFAGIYNEETDVIFEE